MWPGWVALGPGDPFVGDDYVELVNNQRAFQYAQKAGIGWLLDCLDCPEAGLVMPGGPDFVSPTADPAPWYDPDNPDTWGFYGVVGLEVVGADASTRQVTITNTLQAGGVAGPPYYGPRTIVFRGLLIAQDECSLQAGLDWVRMITVISEDPCHGDALTFFDCCPCMCDDDEPSGPCWTANFGELTNGPTCAPLGYAPPAYFNGTTGSMIGPYTTNVPALGDFDNATFVFHVRGPTGTGTVAAQWAAGTSQRSWQVQMVGNTSIRLLTSGNGTTTTTQIAPSSGAAAGADQYLALSRQVTGTTESISSWVSSDGVSWGLMGSSAPVTSVEPLDVSETLPMRIANAMSEGVGIPDSTFPGRIYSVELREGLDPSPGASVPGVVFSGAVNNYLSVANSDPLNVPDDLEVVFAVDTEDFLSFGKWRDPDGRSWRIVVLDTFITLFYSLNGTTSLSVSSAAFSDTSLYHWYKVTRQWSDGVVQFWRAPLLKGSSPEPSGAEWELISTATGTGGGLPYIVGGPPVEIGGNATVASDARLYRTIVRNFITTSVTTETIHFSGVSGVRLAAPTSSALNMVGDLDIVLRATMMTTDTATHTFLCKSGAASNRSWEVGYSNSRWFFQFCTAASPSSVNLVQPNVAQTTGTAMWVRVTRTSATGNVSMYTAVDSATVPTSWTLIGSVTSATGTLVNSTEPVTIGGRNSGTADLPIGRVRRAIVRNGIGGPAVLDVIDTDPTDAAVSTFASTSGHLMTVYRNNSATPLYGTVLDVNAQAATDGSFPATTGQTVTVVGDPVADIPAQVLWRFDASEHPIGGPFPLGSIDYRGRLWYLASGGLSPAELRTLGDVWWPRTYAELTAGPPVDDEDWCSWPRNYYDLTNGPPGWVCCVDDCVVPYLRQFHNARITSGPIILRQPVMNTCGAMAEIEVTLVAADPRKYTLPSAALREIVDPGEPHVEAETVDAEAPDPFVIPGVTVARSAAVATRTVERRAQSPSWLRTSHTSTAAASILPTAVPIIQLTSANGDIGEVRLGLWRGGSRIGGFWLPFIPSGSTVTIDGALRRVIGGVNGSSRILSNFVRDYDGGRLTWPELGHGVFELTVDQEPERAGRIVVEVHAVDVVLS